MNIHVAGFMCAWTPYAVVAMYIVFVDSKGFSPTVEAVPSMIAKSSMLWTSVLYFVLNKNAYRFDSPDDNDEDNENQQQNEIDGKCILNKHIHDIFIFFY